MNSFQHRLQQIINQQQEKQLYRQRHAYQAAQDVYLYRENGQKLLNFSSNDYLGFANHPELKQVYQCAIARYGCGSGASHLISGHSQAHHLLEQELAELLNVPACLVYSSGYMANLGIFEALLDKQDAVFQDKLNHASLIDGVRLSRAQFKRFHHLDYAQLNKQLQQSDARIKMIASDGVFSMDGDCADLPQLINLSKSFDAPLMMDDAHAFGVMGERGLGTPDYFQQAHSEIDVYMATMGKALGCSGAFIAGSKGLIEALVQKSRSYTYTTAMPAVQAEVLRCALKLMQLEIWRREHLQQLIAYFKKIIEQTGLPFLNSNTAIQPMLVGNNEDLLSLQQQLLAENILLSAIRSPTVAKGSERLRITLCASHKKTHIDQLVEKLLQFYPDGIYAR